MNKIVPASKIRPRIIWHRRQLVLAFVCDIYQMCAWCPGKPERESDSLELKLWNVLGCWELNLDGLWKWQGRPLQAYTMNSYRKRWALNLRCHLHGSSYLLVPECSLASTNVNIISNDCKHVSRICREWDGERCLNCINQVGFKLVTIHLPPFPKYSQLEIITKTRYSNHCICKALDD